MLLLLYCIEIISVAPIIGSVIGKTIYWLCFLYTSMMKKATDTDMYMYILEILAHVHQTMFTNTSSYISCTTMLLLLLQCTVSCCSNTAAINNINWSYNQISSNNYYNIDMLGSDIFIDLKYYLILVIGISAKSHRCNTRSHVSK